MVLALAGCAALAAGALPRPPLLVWNASASVPTGLYRIGSGEPIRRGALVVAWLPGGPRALAARRGYIPAHVPVVKRVAAVPGDRICAHGAAILVDGRLAALRRAADGRGRPLPWWRGCGILHRSVLLLGDDPASFDGRYFGPMAQARILGTAHAL